MNKIYVSSIMLLLCSTLVMASKIDGKWKATIESDAMGTMEFTLEYKVDGESLSGTLISDFGDLPITGGKVNGNEFEYKIDVMDSIIEHKGKLINDNEITIKSIGGQGESEFTITRIPEIVE
jgi:hypothetical protein